MSMGWVLVGKKYTSRQIASVGMLTVGVILSTWSNAHNQVRTPSKVGVNESRKRRMQNNSMREYLYSLWLRYCHLLWGYMLNQHMLNTEVTGEKVCSTL